MIDKEDMLPAVIRLARSIPIEHDDPVKQANYVNGYLIGLLNAMYDQLPEVQQVIDHILATKENDQETGQANDE